MDFSYFLDSRFRGNDTLQPAWPSARPASRTARGEAAMWDSRLRGNDTLGLARQENGRLLHSAKMSRLTVSIGSNTYNLWVFDRIPSPYQG